ncbi:MAG TPA: hypothetical protein VFN88_06825 [Caulobacteraceae bacterium]|nr:hypothetical protein [Caulobacteraceae bacterium]
MRAYDLFQRYMLRRLEARQRGMAPRRMVDFAIVVSAVGAGGLIAAAFALRAPGLGVELGARLVFAMLVLVAVRPWLKG